MSGGMGFLGLLAALATFLVLGLGLWGLGQWLRRRGHGATLDRIDARVTKAQRGTVSALGPLGGLFTGFGRAMSGLRLFGSRRQRAMWDELHRHAQRRSPTDKHQ